MDYGYKLCYKKKLRSKWKVYFVTNTYHSAEWHKNKYETCSPIKNATWIVLPIRTRKEFMRRWKGCPF